MPLQTMAPAPEVGSDWVLEDAQAAAGIDPAASALAEAQAAADADAQNDLQGPPALTDLDRVAQELGWTPKDQWRGDPAKWTSSAEYLRTTGRVLERTKNDLKLTRREIEAQNARLARLEQSQNTLTQRSAETLFQEYENAKFMAAKNGDNEMYRKLADEQRQAMEAMTPQQQQPQPMHDVEAEADAIMSDPVAARFYQANPFVLQDETAFAVAERERQAIAQRGGTPAQQFRAAEEALRWAFPDAYGVPARTQPRADNGQFVGQQQRRPAPPINGASRVNSAPAAQTAVARLDAEARSFLDAQIKSNKVKDPETWARRYLGENVPIMNGASR